METGWLERPRPTVAAGCGPRLFRQNSGSPQGAAVLPFSLDDNDALEEIGAPFCGERSRAEGQVEVRLVGAFDVVDEGAITQGDPPAIGGDTLVGGEPLRFHRQDKVDPIARFPLAADNGVAVLISTLTVFPFTASELMP